MPSTSSVRVDGIQQVTALLKNLGDAAHAMSALRVRAGSPSPYAYGIRTGRTRGGRLARRAGGTRAIDLAYAALAPAFMPSLLAAIPLGADATRRVLVNFAQAIVQRVQATEAVKSGALRASYRVERG